MLSQNTSCTSRKDQSISLMIYLLFLKSILLNGQVMNDRFCKTINFSNECDTTLIGLIKPLQDRSWKISSKVCKQIYFQFIDQNTNKYSSITGPVRALPIWRVLYHPHLRIWSPLTELVKSIQTSNNHRRQEYPLSRELCWLYFFNWSGKRW